MKKLFLIPLLMISAASFGFQATPMAELSYAEYQNLLKYIQQNEVATGSEQVYQLQYQREDKLGGRDLPAKVLLKQNVNPPSIFTHCYKKSNSFNQLKATMWLKDKSC